VIHDKGTILLANNRFAEMFGYETSEIIGRLATDFASPECREDVAQNMIDEINHPYPC